MLYQDLLAIKPVLEPVDTPIAGLSEPLKLHLFTWDDYAEKVMKDGDDSEKTVMTQVLYFLGGLEADVSDEARQQLKKTFASWQIRDIYQKGMRLNGSGPDAVRDALKN